MQDLTGDRGERLGFNIKAVCSVLNTITRDAHPYAAVRAQAVVRRLMRSVAITETERRQETFEYLSGVTEFTRYITGGPARYNFKIAKVVKEADQAQRSTCSAGECCIELHKKGIPALVLVTSRTWSLPHLVAYEDRIVLPKRLYNEVDLSEARPDWFGYLFALYPVQGKDGFQFAAVTVPEIFMANEETVAAA